MPRSLDVHLDMLSPCLDYLSGVKSQLECPLGLMDVLEDGCMQLWQGKDAGAPSSTRGEAEKN